MDQYAVVHESHVGLGDLAKWINDCSRSADMTVTLPSS
jgi:hypothetical protein